MRLSIRFMMIIVVLLGALSLSGQTRVLGELIFSNSGVSGTTVVTITAKSGKTRWLDDYLPTPSFTSAVINLTTSSDAEAYDAPNDWGEEGDMIP